jgi:hypothetical protein
MPVPLCGSQYYGGSHGTPQSIDSHQLLAVTGVYLLGVVAGNSCLPQLVAAINCVMVTLHVMSSELPSRAQRPPHSSLLL